MADIFSVDTKVLKQIEKLFKDAPDLIRPATAEVLTQLARGTKTQAVRNLKSNLTIRNNKFLESSIRVRPARPVAIESQSSEVFTAPRKGFTGWTEQEFGARTQLKRTITGKGAREQWSQQIPFAYRHNKKFLSINDFKFNNKGEARRYGYLAYMARAHKNKPFILADKTGNLRSGSLVWKGTKLKRLGYYSRTHQPPKKPWLTPAGKTYLNNAALARVWQKSLQNAFNKRINIK